MRLVRRFWWIVPLVIVIAAVGFIAWASTTNPLEPAAETALVTDSAVTVDSSRWLVFKPNVEATTGLIFYPGGKVNPAAYAPLARAAAEAGFLAVIVPMPLNLAILDTSAADAVIDAFPS
ncbi:MAG: alpha/beta hydrolase, partial [Anaerolinea sp.]|nr:alpha/beta hydrolase [Anaerolinea sp.]